MNLNDLDDDSDQQSDYAEALGEDIDVHLNHYRVPKLSNYGYGGLSNPPRTRVSREQVKCCNGGKIMTLAELATQKVACHLPFGLVEHYRPPVPEPVQCRIAFWSFPQDEEDVKLYTCLANGNADYFYRAEELIVQNAVRDILQVGFHLSANVEVMSDNENLEFFRVAVTFDRRRITSCSCTCMTSTFWCQHVVAVCLQRIRNPQEVKIRAPVSESLQRLEKNQLQKFAQYLINELPQQILPAAQKLLDELLAGDSSSINLNPGAPDPTAGATIDEHTSWCLDFTHLSLDIHRILLKQCTAQPTVCSDIQSLHVTAPPATTEYQQLLRPIRGREPEGIWNLISIVGEMMKKSDPNLFLLLEIMTDEVMKFDKIVTWWFETKVSMHSGSSIHFGTTKNPQNTSQYSSSNFCDEIVHLWRLAALNPNATSAERQELSAKFVNWHLAILKKHNIISEGNPTAYEIGAPTSRRNLLELFPGFKSAIEGCHIDWSDWDEKSARLTSIVESTETALVEGVKIKAKRRNRRTKRHKAKSEEQQAQVAEHDTPSNEKVDEEVGGCPNQGPEDARVAANNDDVECEQVEVNAGIGEQEQQQQQQQEEQNDGGSGSNTPRQEPLREEHEDDLQVYFMNKLNILNGPKTSESDNLADLIKINEKRLADRIETLYAKTQGLHAHGHLEEARKVARQLATEILSQPNYPSTRQLFFNSARRRKKKGSLDNQMSIVATETLAKINFLCNVLIDDQEKHCLIFRLVMFGIELKRAPAATRPLEVKLISQKQELIAILKNITLRDEDFETIRLKAKTICESSEDVDRLIDPLTTLILGNYIFDVLVLSRTTKQPEDAELGFQCALSAIGVKINILETDHPLLCEGIRRQRGELALSLMIHHKDDQEKLDAILKQLLDKDLIRAKPICCEHSSGITDATCSTSGDTTTACKEINSDVTDCTGSKKAAAQQPDLNLPTEAAAHFMFELAKTVFDKAGGSSNTAHLFRPQLVAQNGARGIHRKLHMCTLRIALYALGLQNRTQSNWMQRTYNGRAMFVHEQALELGLPGIKFLCENWEGYLTPVEAALIADKARCSSDADTKRIAAEMAKSCLRYANFLDFNCVGRILTQCNEQTVDMFEEACGEIEQLAEDDRVCADVLFATARAWHKLYLDLIKNERHCVHENSYQLTCSEHQDTGADSWGRPVLTPAQQAHVDENHQMVDVFCPPTCDIYDRSEFMLTRETPTHKNLDFVRNAFRVGVKALDSFRLSMHAVSKHNQTKMRDEILWLLQLAKALGRESLYIFGCKVVLNIHDPFILHLIIYDIIEFFEIIKLPGNHIDHVNILGPIFDKCVDRCVKQTRDVLKHAPYESNLDTILDVMKNLTAVTKKFTAAQHYKKLITAREHWEILAYLKLKFSPRAKNTRKFKFYQSLLERLKWLETFNLEEFNQRVPCDDCYRQEVQRFRGGKSLVSLDRVI